MNRLLILGVLSGLVLATGSQSAEPEKPKATTFEGKVYPTSVALKKLGIFADNDSDGLALVTDDGTLYTLVKDDESRILFLDAELRKRTFRLTAVKVAGSQMLQVKKVQTIKEGIVYNVDYWCEHCQLAAPEPGRCVCCGAIVALRELPVDPKKAGK